MDNNEIDPALRMKAAIEVGTFAAYSGALDRPRLTKLNLASEAAIKQYRRHFSEPTAKGIPQHSPMDF